MKEEYETKTKTARNIGIAGVIIAAIALIVGLIFPTTDTGNLTKSITYDAVAPYIKDYLVSHDLLDENGLVPVPNTGSDEPDTATIEEVIDQLISTGKFDYLKGEKGDTGATGARGQDGATGKDGATGAQGEQGTPGSYAGKGDKGDKGDTGATGATGAAGQDGLIAATDGSFVVSGGTLSLKPCALDKVLMSNGTTWNCATVSSSGVDADTTNISATLTLNGTSLEASITDSDGNTVNTPPIDLGSTFATDLELSNAITTAVNGLNLSQYATTGQLTALTSRVTTLETTSSDHEGRIAALESGASSGYVTDTELTTALGAYYKKSETYSQTEVDTKLTNLENDIDTAKQDKLPTCTDGQVIKYNATTLAWECATDLNNVSGDGSNFATENWVNTYVASQNFATTSALNTLDGKVSGNTTAITNLDTRVATIEGAGYITASALAPYLKTADLTAEVFTRLVAGTGISINQSSGTITINSAAQTDVFEVTSDHTTITTPDSNKIYIDTGTDPASQWVYENSVWAQVGEVNVDMAGYYTKTQTDSQIASAISTNNAGYTTTTDLNALLANKADQSALNTANTNLSTTNSNLATAQQGITDLQNNLSTSYTTTSALAPLLAAKQDKLPTCADGEVVKYVLATNSWACGTDNNTSTDLTGYAKENWVTSQITTNNNNYTTTADLTALLAAKADKTALAATNTALATETTNRTNGDTALDGRLDTIEADYLTSGDLNNYVTTTQIADMATKTWVQGQSYLTESTADLAGYARQSWVTGQNYITSTSLTATLADYATNSALTTATTDMATNANISNNYVPKSALNCGTTQALVGTGTNGTVNCRAIQDITTGSLTANNNIITANTLATVMEGYYDKTEIDTMLSGVRAASYVPDYATKTLKASSITTAPATWTADRDGFVYAGGGSTLSDGTTGSRLYITVNGKEAWTILTTTFAGYVTFPVKGGDVISFKPDPGHVLTGTYIYYMSPAAVMPPYINENYSLTEVNTGKTWVDGKAIYRRTIQSTTAPANYAALSLGNIAGLSEIVSWNGSVQTSANDTMPINFNISGAYLYVYRSGNNIYETHYSANGTDYAGKQIEVIVEYTKN